MSHGLPDALGWCFPLDARRRRAGVRGPTPSRDSARVGGGADGRLGRWFRPEGEPPDGGSGPAGGIGVVPMTDLAVCSAAVRRARRPGLACRGVAVALAILLLASSTTVARAAPPTDAERVAYWLERILRGPEPSRLALADFHQGVLSDAQGNLERLPDATLDRLDDPALRQRVLANPDINPWHGLLAVLARIGPRRPAVARAWAAPGLLHDDRQIREQALTAVVALGSAEDAPAVLALLRRDAADRVMAPVAITALVALGPPWDGAAARTALEVGRDDGAGVGSTAWASVVGALAASKAPSRDAVLAWIALVAETGGPRAPFARTRSAALAPDDPRDVVPLAALRTSGRRLAAVARTTLARAGFAPWRAAVETDLRDCDDPDLGKIAEQARPRDAAAKAAALRRLADLAGRARTEAVPPEVLSSAVAEVVSDRADGAGTALAACLAVLPADAAYGEALLRAFDGARALGVEPVEVVRAMLASGDPTRIELAMRLVRRAPDGPYLDVVEPWLATVTDPVARSEGRRATVFLHAVGHGKGRLPAARVEAFASVVRAWGEDPSDPSAAGLLGGLLDLGPAGEREVAAGLRGPSRAVYVDLLASSAARFVGPEVVEALVAPLSARTPAAERVRVFTAVFRCAGADALPALEAAVGRLAPADRADGEALLRLVGHRASRP